MLDYYVRGEHEIVYFLCFVCRPIHFEGCNKDCYYFHPCVFHKEETNIFYKINPIVRLMVVGGGGWGGSLLKTSLNCPS